MAAQDHGEFEVEVAERTRAERAGVTFAARLAGSRGTTVTLTVTTGDHVAGRLADVTAQWIRLARDGMHLVVPTHAIVGAQGLRREAAELSVVQQRLTLGHALRALSRDRARVSVMTAAARADGVLGAVGRDCVDVVADSGATCTVPYAAVVWVRSAEGSGL